MSILKKFFKIFFPNQPDQSSSETTNEPDGNNNVSSPEWSVDRIKNRNSMITDNEIFAALKILKSQFGRDDLKGFHDTLSMNAKWTKKTDFYVPYPARFVQILHDGDLHWYTVSNVASSHPEKVHVYDSLFMDATYINNKSLQISLSKLLKPPDELEYKSVVECIIEPVQKQSDFSLCGMFAIAFAVDLCQGVEPNRVIYDESRMRQHLLKCLEMGRFEEFPKLELTALFRGVFQEPQIIYIDV